MLRHSLADELSSLTESLVSSTSESASGPTLLEDLENCLATHDRLKDETLHDLARFMCVGFPCIAHFLTTNYLPRLFD